MVSEFANAVRELRLASRLSQAALANRVNVVKSYIGLIENGKRLPHPDLAKAIDVVLAADGRLATLAADIRVLHGNGGDVNRRDVIKAVIAGTTVVAGGQRAGATDVQRLGLRISRLRKLDDTLGGADTYSIYLREMRATRALVKYAGYSEATGMKLLGLLAEQAQLAGWSAFDAGWNAEARDLFKRSHEWATSAGHQSLAANALALMAYQDAFSGQPNPTLASASCDQLTEQMPATVRALVYERAAWTYAVAGCRGESDLALDQAREALRADADAHCPDWTAWVDASELTIMTGRCQAALSGSSAAIEPLTSALAAFPDEFARDKALYLLALAKAYTHAAQAEEAAAVVVRAAELASGVSSRRPRVHLAEVVSELAPYADVPAVIEMNRRLAWIGQLDDEVDS